MGKARQMQFEANRHKNKFVKKDKREGINKKRDKYTVTCLVTVDGVLDWQLDLLDQLYNTWLHFTVPCNTHALIFLVLVWSQLLSPLSWPPNQDCNCRGPVHSHNCKCNTSLQADFFITQLTESHCYYTAESSPARAQDLLQTHSLHGLISEDGLLNSENCL
jgi:hypothetical protein